MLVAVCLPPRATCSGATLSPEPWRVARDSDPPDAEPASVTERSAPFTAGALAVERRRTASTAAERERQALMRRAASVGRAVHSGATLRMERLGSCERLCGGPPGVFHLPPEAALLREVSRMQNLRLDFFF